MTVQLLITLLNYKRIPLYLESIFYHMRACAFSYKRNFKGMISLPQGMILHKLASTLPKNSTIVEIGCYGGLSTAYLLAGAKNKSKVYSIDPFDRDVKKQKRYLATSKDKGYVQGEMPMLENKPSKQEVAKKLNDTGFSNFVLIEGYSNGVFKKWNKKIDFLWIDGDHNYVQVKKDFLQWTKYLKKGAVIALDDANKKDNSKNWNMGLPGPTKVAKELIKSPKWINIQRAEAMVFATKNY